MVGLDMSRRVLLNVLKYLGIVFLNMIYIFAFYAIIGLDKLSQYYSLLHAIISGILIIQLNNILKRRGRLSLGFLLMYVLGIYFQLSMTKYSRVDVFYGFSTDNRIRFQGTIITFLILFAVNKLQLVNKDEKNVSYIDMKEKPAVYKLWAWIISLILFIYYFFVYDYSNSIYISANYKAQSKIVNIALNIAIVLGIYLAGLYLDIRRPITYFPFVIDAVSFVYYSLNTGSRANFFACALLILFILFENKILKYEWFAVAQISSPWFMIFFTYLAFRISGRYSSNFTKIAVTNVAYRFDLSDLAVNIMNNTSWFRFDLSEIWSGLQNCIPSFISIQYKGFEAYYSMLSEAHLIPTVDYSDTILSMGASAGGIIGMIIIIPTFYVIYEIIGVRLSKLGNKGILIKMICILSLMRIEIEWTSFIPELRNMCLSILIIFVAFKLISIKYFWGGHKI